MPSTPPPSGSEQTPAVLFFGTLGAFSLPPLLALLAAGVEVRAVVMPAARADPMEAPIRYERPPPPPRATLPLLTRYHQPSIVTIAWERGIPLLLAARERDPLALRTLAAYDADALCVACWPRRLPAPLLTLPRLGALNLHPSLLPAHRGPAPLFWTLRHGDGHAGVSIHVMDETLDGAPLLAQVPIELADGMTGAEIERKCATVGGQLMADAVRALASGDVRPATQAADRGSYESWPTPADFVVTPEHSAHWAFNFIKGAAYWGGPLVIRAGGQSFAVQTALDYTVAQPSHAPETAGKVRRVDNELWLACSPGTLHVRLAEPTARERLAHAPSATLRARDASDQ